MHLLRTKCIYCSSERYTWTPKAVGASVLEGSGAQGEGQCLCREGTRCLLLVKTQWVNATIVTKNDTFVIARLVEAQGGIDFGTLSVSVGITGSLSRKVRTVGPNMCVCPGSWLHGCGSRFCSFIIDSCLLSVYYYSWAGVCDDTRALNIPPDIPERQMLLNWS